MSYELQAFLDERQDAALVRMQAHSVALRSKLRSACQSWGGTHPYALIGIGAATGFLAEPGISRVIAGKRDSLARSALRGLEFWALSRFLG